MRDHSFGQRRAWCAGSAAVALFGLAEVVSAPAVGLVAAETTEERSLPRSPSSSSVPLLPQILPGMDGFTVLQRLRDHKSTMPGHCADGA